MRPTRLVLDVDTGTDDAIAIMLAALDPRLELVACTTVSGNADVATCTSNTLAVLDAIGRHDIPVHEGLSARSLPVDDVQAARSKALHGTRLPVPPSSRRKSATSAVDYLLERFARPPEADGVVLVATAPLTNIAAAVAADPLFSSRVPRLVVMGGGHAIANATPAAEFNIWADPEAAALVFSAGFPRLELVTLDATHSALVSVADCHALEAAGTHAGSIAASLIGKRIEGHDATQPMPTLGTAPLHDALAVAMLIHPELLPLQELHVAVETDGRLTRGRTVIDLQRRGSSGPNCRVALTANGPGFVALLREALGMGGPAAPPSQPRVQP